MVVGRSGGAAGRISIGMNRAKQHGHGNWMLVVGLLMEVVVGVIAKGHRQTGELQVKLSNRLRHPYAITHMDAAI